MGINDLEIYREAMDLGEEVWARCQSMRWFSKHTLGRQWVRSMDSVAANLAEGHGRYHYGGNRKFCYYARGSLLESQTWLEKAVRRKIVDQSEGRTLYSRLETLRKRLNAYIRQIGPAPTSEPSPTPKP